MININPGPYEASILADSVAPNGSRLTTIVCTFPRFILAEFNTHRVFSRNSASSRAIPVKKRIKMIEENAFVPLAFGKNQRGMSSSEDLQGEEAALAEKAWREACEDAVKHARKLSDLGVHKQFANRILEPFAWHTVITTSTEWDNYWALRISEHAQPEIHRVSQAMKDAFDTSDPEKLIPGDWHLPLIFEEDYEECTNQDGVDYELLAKISCARCARVSYLTHGGVRSLDKDLELFERLASRGHMSPLEHAAFVGEESYHSDRGGILTPDSPYYAVLDEFVPPTWNEGNNFIGNFREPWVQYRKLVPNEAVFNG